MESTDVAACLVARHGGELGITNLKLNKLVYFCQVESLRESGQPLFSDGIEAWRFGPVEPAAYRRYRGFGRDEIPTNGVDPTHLDARASRLVESVARTYGSLDAYDLVDLTHRAGGAWSRAYRDGAKSPLPSGASWRPTTWPASTGSASRSCRGSSR